MQLDVDHSASENSADRPSPVFLTQLVEALALLNIKVVSPYNELQFEEGAANAPAASVPAAEVAKPSTAVMPVGVNIKPSTAVMPVGVNTNPGTRYPPVGPVTSSAIVPGTIATIQMTPSVIKIADIDNNADKAAAGNEDKEKAEHGGASAEDDQAKGSGAEEVAGAGNASDGDKPSGFVCVHCHQHNVLRSSKDTVYLVTVGRAVGVFSGWHNVQPLVSGVPHACFKKYSSKDAAVEAFEEALAKGLMVVV